MYERADETTRKGFYVYNDKRTASPDPELKIYIEKSREIYGNTVDPKVHIKVRNLNLFSVRNGVIQDEPLLQLTVPIMAVQDSNDGFYPLQSLEVVREIKIPKRFTCY